MIFFATLRDRAGSKAVELDIPEGMRISELKQKLAFDYPTLKPSMETVLIAINREYAFDDAAIPLDAEIAMFPPVSGG